MTSPHTTGELQGPPFRLLALDGGGIRGLISIEVLADYFDYIGGTSTGAIIATCLALGMRVDQIRAFYLENGKTMFHRASVFRRHQYKFESDELTRTIQQHVGTETTLGDPRLRTLLMVVMRNASTNSPWPISNNPAALYNRRDRPGRPHSNLDLKLWQLVRASTAAPTYFPPEVIRVNAGASDDLPGRSAKDYIFVDGGLTVFNNPAFQLFLMATAQPYNLNWPAGEHSMLVVSVGTGQAPKVHADLMPRQMHLLYHAGTVPAALTSAACRSRTSCAAPSAPAGTALRSTPRSATCAGWASRGCPSSSPTCATTRSSRAPGWTCSGYPTSSRITCSGSIPSTTWRSCGRSAGPSPVRCGRSTSRISSQSPAMAQRPCESG
jgi:predicted acylesterase/phospholipase RssA